MLAVDDITAERELDSMKSDFVSFVAHELRSPLTSILGYASLLQSAGAVLDAEKRTLMTDAILRQGTRLNRMISELLDMSRLEAGKPLDLHLTPVDLVTLCRAAMEAQRAGLPDRNNYQLDMCAPSGPIMVSADADRLEQVVVNLLSNAVKYSPDGGHICLVIEEDSDSVRLLISDTGMGMSPEQVDALFQKYYRTPQARQSGIKGTGLGLYLVKNLLEAQNGSIQATSELAKGTTFIVRLPKNS